MASQEEPRTIEAQQFIVRDAAGKIRATLGVLNSSGEACLSLHDKSGIPRLYAEMVDDYPRICCLQRDGNPLFSFSKREDGSPALGLSRNCS